MAILSCMVCECGFTKYACTVCTIMAVRCAPRFVHFLHCPFWNKAPRSCFLILLGHSLSFPLSLSLSLNLSHQFLSSLSPFSQPRSCAPPRRLRPPDPTIPSLPATRELRSDVAWTWASAATRDKEALDDGEVVGEPSAMVDHWIWQLPPLRPPKSPDPMRRRRGRVRWLATGGAGWWRGIGRDRWP